MAPSTAACLAPLLFILLGIFELASVNSTEIKINKAPYLVSVSSRGKFICGGAIVSNSWVITTASCMDGLVAGELEVRAGSASQDTNGSVVGVASVVVHENFTSWSMDYDVALLQLDHDLDFGPKVLPVRIPTDPQQDGWTVILTGWTSNGGNLTLEQCKETIQNKDECRKKISTITESMLCTVPMTKDATCDSQFGSPLVNEWKALTGLFSWRKSGPDMPTVYTNIAPLRPWIKSHTCFM